MGALVSPEPILRGATTRPEEATKADAGKSRGPHRLRLQVLPAPRSGGQRRGPLDDRTERQGVRSEGVHSTGRPLARGRRLRRDVVPVRNRVAFHFGPYSRGRGKSLAPSEFFSAAPFEAVHPGPGERSARARDLSGRGPSATAQWRTGREPRSPAACARPRRGSRQTPPRLQVVWRPCAEG